MKNTLENKAKFFAQYYKQYVLRLSGKTKAVYPVSNLMDNTVEVGYLELKPLSSISDENVIILWDFVWGKSVLSSSNSIENKRSRLLQYSGYARFIDKARELGYACNWNGITVEQQIEFGWIKLKE